jgi:hypothetical protein
VSRYHAHAWGFWWCWVDGWVSADKLRFPMHISAGCALRDAQPGVVLYEVSA